jgi:AmmeMemoRadiSam system protein A
VQELQTRSREQGIDLLGINDAFARQHKLNAKLDHGILVPLSYLEKAGLRNQAVVAISVGLLDPLDLYRFGKLIQETAANLHRRVAVVASGDMSHRLKEEGPYHYHPDASRFDHLVQDLLAKADVEGLLQIPADLREHAGECGYPSISIMLGTLDGYEIQSKVFGYEGPFGVGYLTVGLQAIQKTNSMLETLHEKQTALIREKRGQESAPVKWARLNLEHRITGKAQPALEGDMQQLLQQKSAAFVSIKKNGQLRGCIGTFLPVYENLAEEIKHNAFSAGLRDPRFPPVEADELSSLVYSVDILTEPEPCTREDLDPKKYGVIVSRGGKRGLLLPDLDGVDTVEEQLLIALQKAGISSREKYSIERFQVKRFV